MDRARSHIERHALEVARVRLPEPQHGRVKKGEQSSGVVQRGGGMAGWQGLDSLVLLAGG